MVVMDADCARKMILAKSGGMPRSPDMTQDWWKVLSGDPKVVSFFTSPTPTPYVKAIRRTMARCMTSASLKTQIPKLNVIWSTMRSIIDKGCNKGPIDIEDLLVRATLDAAGSVFFDYDFNEMKGNICQRKIILDALLEMIRIGRNPVRNFTFQYLPFLKSNRESKAKFRRVLELWMGVAHDIRERKYQGNADVDMWAALDQFIDPTTGRRLDIQKLAAEVGTAIIGGMDTTSHTMGWTLALLSSHPHTIDRIVDELKMHGVMGKEAKEIDFDRLHQLEYLVSVLKEAMRLVHVPVVARRFLDKDMTICGYRLPKGTNVHVAGMNMVNSEEDWDDPLVFKPERWLRGEDASKKFYFPFSYGERDCIGQRFAMTLMLFLLSKFVANFEFRLIEGASFEKLYAEQVMNAVVESRDGIRMHICPRE